MKELRFVASTHAEVFVHFGVVRLDLQPFLLGEVGDLPRVDFDGALDGSLVLVGLRLWAILLFTAQPTTRTEARRWFRSRAARALGTRRTGRAS
jgi:hypothetical protein